MPHDHNLFSENSEGVSETPNSLTFTKTKSGVPRRRSEEWVV